MTASLLLGAISPGLLLQLAIAIAVAVSRRRQAGPNDGPPAGEATAPLAAWLGWRAFRVTARQFENPAQTQCSFHLAPIDGAPLPPFVPGQFLTFSLKIGEDATRNTVRRYSLSDRPDPVGYRVTIKRTLAPDDKPDLPPGLASGHFHDRLAVGDIIMAKAPAGQFTLDPDPGIVSALIAGRIGITPMISMLVEALGAQPDRPMHLFYGVRTRKDYKQLHPLRMPRASGRRDHREAHAQRHPRLHELRRLPPQCERAVRPRRQGGRGTQR